MLQLASFQKFKPFHQLLHNVAAGGGGIPSGREKKARAWNTALLIFPKANFRAKSVDTSPYTII